MSKTYIVTEEQLQDIRSFVNTVDPMDNITTELEQEIVCEILEDIHKNQLGN